MIARLTEAEVLDFGVREIRAVLGEDFPGRVFLAGGAFKALLTGRAPRDLDLWAPTPADRTLLVQRLAVGSLQAERHPFGDLFTVGGRTVDVPDRTEPRVLEDRLARFDLALSAIGVEWSAGEVRAVVHPLVHRSVQRAEVLLLWPLVNWRHCLATLARARKYGQELGFAVPDAEEAAVWEVFDAQPPEMQRQMIDRYHLAATQGWGVLEEATSRLKR